jgi:hypothetical protein
LSSAVTVCCVESSNFQVTVVPAGTDSVFGLNAKLLISTVEPPPAAADPLDTGAGALVGVDEPDEPSPLEPQAAAPAAAINATAIIRGRRRRTDN